MGRGMASLFGNIEELEQEALAHGHVTELELTQLRANPYQPRFTFNPDALAELAESIKNQGVFQPIIVRKSAVKGYEIIAGERRFRASKLAGKKTIPAIIQEMDESTMMEVAVLENIQREDLNPIEEAMSYEMLMKNLDLTQEAVAIKVSKSRPYVANLMRLLTLPKVVVEALRSGDLTPGVAKPLVGLSEADATRIAKRAVAEKWNARQVEDFVKQLKDGKVPTGPAKKKAEKPEYARETEERLMDKFGTSVVLVDNKGKGKIEIEYLSEADLTRILDILEITFDED
ncbi:MAG: ParB/RepB/Spo0J family partition protein [Lactobacillales bacterium]|nr:ParB/RepB/Spo0J family partition protein [Lactobacillales bacterium]